jgi:hypothetical protein
MPKNLGGRAGVSFIVSRNVRDYSLSSVETLHLQDFLKHDASR